MSCLDEYELAAQHVLNNFTGFKKQNALAALTTKHPMGLSLASCGNEKKYYCNNWKFCTTCSTIKANKIMTKIPNKLKNFKFVTIKHPLPIGHVSLIDNFTAQGKKIGLLWDAQVTVLKQQTKNAKWGVYREELAVCSFSDLTVNPHLHSVVSDSDIKSDGKYVHVSDIETTEELQKAIYYIMKPLNMSHPLALEGTCSEAVKGLRLLLDGYKQILARNRRQLVTYGTL